MELRLPEKIPQFLEFPECRERFAQKAFSGSYKAAEILLGLFEFTIVSLIDGDPLNDLSIPDLDKLICSRSEQQQVMERPAFDVISSCVWPPVGKSGEIVINVKETQVSAEFLWLILKATDHLELVRRMVAAYKREECYSDDYFALGVNLQCIGVSRSFVEGCVELSGCQFRDRMLEGISV